MKVGLVTDFYYPWIGGPSMLLRNLGHGLAARGHSVSLLAPSASGEGRKERDGDVSVTRVRTLPSPFGYQLRVAPFPVRTAAAWMDEERPDVVHLHHPFPLCAAALLAARRRGIPIAATNHTIPDCTLWGIRGVPPAHAAASWAFGAWLRLLLGQCDAVATPTATAARLLQATGFSGTVRTISNGIDSDRFSPGPPNQALRKALGLSDDPIVLYTGRLDAEKDMDVWLQAAAMLQSAPRLQFVIGGKGADRPRLERLVETMGLGGQVHFIGYVTDAELPDLYRLATVYFITSQVELQSISTLEAVACGTPVVAVDAGALPELIQDGVNGYLVAPGDPTAASRALTRILADGPTRTRMAAESRKIASRHDLPATIAAYEEFLAGTARRIGERSGERVPASGW